MASALTFALPILASCGGPKTYKITWKNGDEVLEVDENVAEGTTPTYNGATPTKPSTEAENYVFKGWTPEIAPVKSDTTYVAQFDSVAREYTVTFVDYDETVLATQKVKYNHFPDFKSVNVPDHEGREFKTWNPSPATQIKQDTTFTPIYQGKYLTNTVLYADNCMTLKIVSGSTESGSKTKVTLNFHISNETGVLGVEGAFTIKNINGVDVQGEEYEVKKEMASGASYKFEIDGAQWGYVADVIGATVTLKDIDNESDIATIPVILFPTGLTPRI